MGTKERRERERQELRTKILDAARAMFVSEGYQAVTMRSIAKRIEYSATAIYLHFKDKEALLDELCSTDLAELAASVRAEADKTQGIDRLYHVARAYVRFAVDHKAQYQLLFMTPKPGPSDAASSVESAAYQGLRDGFANLIAAGALRSDLKDPDLLAQVYFCGLHGIVASAIAGACALGGWRDAEAQATFFVDSLVKGIKT